jgi:molybdopterin adenylyltransferase
MTLRIGILTISDRVARDAMDDRGGPAIADALVSLVPDIAARTVVPDDRDAIAATLRHWCDELDLDIVLTTGGTGLGPRDVTPEATREIVQRAVPGISEALRSGGLAQTPYAILSRGEAGIRGTTLIVNLPGSPSGAAQGTGLLLPILEHAVAILRGGRH